MSWRLLLTCEHGGCRIPAAWRRQFQAAGPALASHRGHDAGALKLARLLARRLQAPLVASTTSRLLVDLNRSLHHPRLFSEFTRPLTSLQRQAVVAEHWRPHRREVEAAVARLGRRRSTVVHVAVHSFTPVLEGHVRQVDVGLLYDPCRVAEKQFCASWRLALRDALPGLRVRRNQPYRGAADGLTTALRRLHGPAAYLGLELEINQRLLAAGAPLPGPRLQDGLISSLALAFTMTG